MEVISGLLEGRAQAVHQTVLTREEHLAFRSGFAEPELAEAGLAKDARLPMGRPSNVWLYQPGDSGPAREMPGGLSLVQMVLETFFGMKVRVFMPGEFAPSEGEGASAGADAGEGQGSPEGWSMRWDRSEVREQFDSLDIRVSGAVETADGQTVSFDLALSMQRYQREEVHQTVTAGDPWQDPLVLTLPGTGLPSFSSGGEMALDLNADGRTEHLPLLTGESGYLVWDRNGNGQVDDGGELLGALSGDGFAELRGLDSDGSTWIDARDPVYMDLRFWQPEQNSLKTLAEIGLGAVSTVGVGVGTWGLGDEARLRQSGVALFEDGQASWVHQVDLRAGD